MTNEYEWHARIISKNRITIPFFITQQWNLQEGDVVVVSIRRPTKPMRDVII